jgi:hypothetical protein
MLYLVKEAVHDSRLQKIKTILHLITNLKPSDLFYYLA